MTGLLISRLRLGLKRMLKLLLAGPGLLLRSRRPGLRVLFYHRVNAHPPAALGPVSREISVHPTAFEAQLRYLAARGWRGLTLADFEAVLEGRAPLDGRAVLITFDDGYADNLAVAAPLLGRYGFPAVVFAIPGFLGRESGAVWPHGDPAGHGRFLDAEELRRLAGTGIEIGSHTLTHPRLTEIEAPACIHEVGASRGQLEALLARPVTAFAYPEGDLDAGVERAVAAAGYTLAFTTVPGLNRRDTPRLRLRRTEVSASDSLLVFRAKLAGALDWTAFKESPAFRRCVGAVNRMLLRRIRSATP